MDPIFDYPFDVAALLTKKKAIKRQLMERTTSWIPKKIAILGGSTTAEIKDTLELFLLNAGIQPTFYESEYNRFYEDGMFENARLAAFQPDFIWIHTSTTNLKISVLSTDAAADMEAKLREECDRFQSLWDRLTDTYRCPIIQNNFELPSARPLGNLDSSLHYGKSYLIGRMNLEFAHQATKRQNLFINDIHYLSAHFGLNLWHDRKLWFAYKYALSYDAIPFLAHNVTRIMKALSGKTKKVLALDLDDTLWGGVIGDIGVGNIQIGRETASAEAFTAFQEYVRDLRQMGVVLAVVSKNDANNAKEGLAHPDSILCLEDFASFKANWSPKHENILQTAQDLNLLPESFVFVDDNPVERDLVQTQVSGVDVLNLPSHPERYVQALDSQGYFEPARVIAEDLQRNRFYQDNQRRAEIKNQFASYDDYLKSLEMTAEISPFVSIYLERITQLINKTNQFNLTTRRYTLPEVEAVSKDPNCITLYGKLTDKFGDNGLVSIIVGSVKSQTVHIDLWLMSCRVLQRTMENAMFHALVKEGLKRGLHEIQGRYIKTSKNGMVSDLYKSLQWENISQEPNGDSLWRYPLKNAERALGKSLPIRIQLGEHLYEPN